jgi:GTP-binding protein Era
MASETNSAPGATADHRSGFVAIAGRPNAGKSTLLNRILGRKIAGVTPKPQTTRRRLLGIKTLPDVQMLFVDTPGIFTARDLLGERMVETAKETLRDADVVLWLVDASAGVDRDDEEISELIASLRRRVVVVLNKVDAVPKPRLLPIIERLSQLLPDCQPIPISALRGHNVDTVLAAVGELLPSGPQLYPADDLTDETERVLAAEIVREKVMLQTRNEIPYAVAVTVEEFTEKSDPRAKDAAGARSLVVIKAAIHVARESQKAIVIGKRGARIKEIGQAARPEIEDLLGARVYLDLYVRVQPDWTKDPNRLREFGL